MKAKWKKDCGTECTDSTIRDDEMATELVSAQKRKVQSSQCDQSVFTKCLLEDLF